ncbi:MAG: peptide ABC transporter substrate-binding protein [Dehalococcoidia bacterium]
MTNKTLTLLMGLVAFLILAVGVVFVIAIAAGGGDDDDTPAGDDQDDNDDRDSVGGICGGNTLITFGSDPASVLDPIQVRDEGTAEYIVEIFGGLVTLDLELNVVGDIAESWEVSPDGKTYTFKLRNNVVFHNGKRVTAQDFKYSFERAADPAENSPTVTLYLGLIEGVEDKYNGRADEVSGVEVVDERTLKITITQPADYFLAELTYPVAYVVDQEQIESNPRNWTRDPNGTGPFELRTFTPAEEIVLSRNERYHLGVAKLDEVVFELSGGSLSTRYENDELHVGVVPSTDIEAVEDGSSPLAKDYKPQPRMTVSYFAFNVDKEPFDDPKVRQAMAMAIDRETINEVLLFETQRVADGILPPEMPGYDESVSSYEFDAAKAKTTLAESRYANSMPRIILTYAGTGGDAPNVLQAVADMWQQNLGIDVELQASEYSAYLRELRQGTLQMYSAGWAADYPDPEDFLDKLFHSESAQNEQGYSDPEVDRLLEEARSESDFEKRRALYKQVEQKILDEAIIIPDFWPVEHLLVKPCVQNWPTLSMSVPKYRYLEIDASKAD